MQSMKDIASIIMQSMKDITSIVSRNVHVKGFPTQETHGLNLNANSDFINKKCQSRLYCLRKLLSFHVNTDILCTFYHCSLESVLTFSFVCWYSELSVKCKNVLDRVVNVGV